MPLEVSVDADTLLSAIEHAFKSIRNGIDQDTVTVHAQQGTLRVFEAVPPSNVQPLL